MTRKSSPPRRARRDEPPICVWCTPEERALLQSYADSAGLSVSAFMRQVGVGTQPRSIMDFTQAMALNKAGTDMSRLADKLEGHLFGIHPLPRDELSALIREIGVAVDQMGQAAERLIKEKDRN